LLELYEAVLRVQEAAFVEASQRTPVPSDVADFAADRVMPGVVDATLGAGPPALGEAVSARLRSGGLADVARRWLLGESQPAAGDYLAPGATAPVLEALGEGASDACGGAPATFAHCPRCGGRPQVGYFRESSEALVTAPRLLLCCRCGQTWVHERMCCPACG